MPVTDDRNDPRLREVDPVTGLQRTYLVLSEQELSLGYVRPLRLSYSHEKCGTVTTMGVSIAATYARNPSFYGATYCSFCRGHFPVGSEGEFVWVDASGVTLEKVGT